jgi:hypothetical protein
MLDLTEEQCQRLERGEPIEVTEPQTARPCVLLRKDVYERVRHLLCDDADWTYDDLRQQLARSATANGWDEPCMDAYDRYDEERQNRCP